MATNTKYDRHVVIQKATELFWQKGFHATSMRNIQEAVDLRPGSIYAGFGSKEGLFKEALQQYFDQGQSMLKSFENEHESPLEGLKAFMMCITIGQSQAPSNMCMLVKTISELNDNNAELLCEARQLLQSMESSFTEMFRQAQEIGEIDSNKNPKCLASQFQINIMGLRTYLRANDTSESTAQALVDEAFASLL